MKGLIIKDIMCLKKQLTTFVYVISGVVVISILYVLSSRFGNLAEVGKVLLDENNNMTQVDVKNLGSMVLIMSMLIPIVSVGDMVNVFIADGKAGFFKVSASLPVSMKKRMLSRFLTIYALFAIGAAVDIVLAMVLSSLTDIMGFGSFLGIIVSSASLLSIYSAFLILYCVILGYGKEQYAQYFSLLTIALSFVIIKFKSVKFVIIHVLGDGVGFDSSVFWKPLDYFRQKGYVFLLIALFVSVFSYCLSLYFAERKRGVI
ncbi:MAG: ABC-2 transporter permease [Lachnospiraceae bacterium]|nr:ABC-2 transporter permease [Lachnospiraceae bacterium]